MWEQDLAGQTGVRAQVEQAKVNLDIAPWIVEAKRGPGIFVNWIWSWIQIHNKMHDYIGLIETIERNIIIIERHKKAKNETLN